MGSQRGPGYGSSETKGMRGRDASRQRHVVQKGPSRGWNRGLVKEALLTHSERPEYTESIQYLFNYYFFRISNYGVTLLFVGATSHNARLHRLKSCTDCWFCTTRYCGTISSHYNFLAQVSGARKRPLAGRLRSPAWHHRDTDRYPYI
ncbi:hypothetical protein GCK32_010720 [Trichostrongylus colubriformis]|uniref:Uncharacterized protein n=1 Tax=Trichostrongylus colubriformis TaxID=6319 RepID=A0AAN8FVC0_TRICO